MRAGQSLAELVVALTLLSACLGAVGASAVLGARWTTLGELRQDAVWAASAVLDSLMRADSVSSGQQEDGPFTISWTAAGTDGLVPLVVTTTAPAAGLTVELRGAWLPPPPRLPLDAPAAEVAP